MYFAACAIQSYANSYKTNSQMTLVQKIRSGLAVTLIAVSSISTATVRTTGRAPWLGIVTYVIDGDTLQKRALEGGRPAAIRINGIDAPEICQSGGAMARHVLMQRILYKEVFIYGKAQDAYGRLVARIALKGEDQGAWMVANGFAWASSYRNNASAYMTQQCIVRVSSLEIFSSAAEILPIYPAIFRKAHGSCRPSAIQKCW